MSKISEIEILERVARRIRKGQNITQEEAKKQLVKIKERIDRKKGD